jgi:hypothetical protein
MIWGDGFADSTSSGELPKREFAVRAMPEIVAEWAGAALPPEITMACTSDSKKIAERIILAAEKPILAQHTPLETILHTLVGFVAGKVAQKPEIGP